MIWALPIAGCAQLIAAGISRRYHKKTRRVAVRTFGLSIAITVLSLILAAFYGTP